MKSGAKLGSLTLGVEALVDSLKTLSVDLWQKAWDLARG